MTYIPTSRNLVVYAFPESIIALPLALQEARSFCLPGLQITVCYGRSTGTKQRVALIESISQLTHYHCQQSILASA